MFQHILNWKLQTGSHEFPGPDGGTCVLEAAALAAGFVYRPVISVEDDLPECFSRVVASYAISLNDNIVDDDIRQGLLPFVPRLAGTADLPVVEYLRAEFILVETVKRILVPAFSDTWDWDSRPRDMSRVTRLDQAYRIAQFIKYNRVEAWDATSHILEAMQQLPNRDHCPLVCVGYAADCVAYSIQGMGDDSAPSLWDAAFSILYDAITLGRHHVLEPHVVAARLEASKPILVSV
jgi:hypothetical protein